MQTGSLNKIFLLFLLILVFQESPGILTLMWNIISVQFSPSVVSDYLWSPWTTACQAYLSITNSRSLLKFMSIESVMPSNHLILCCPLLLLPLIFPSIRVFSKESVLHIRWPKLLEFQLQNKSFQWIFRIDFLQEWLVWSPCSLRDSQESSPTPQFKSINSSALSFFYSPTLTSIHDHWKNHSLDQRDLCWQSNASAF